MLPMRLFHIDAAGLNLYFCVVFEESVYQIQINKQKKY